MITRLISRVLDGYYFTILYLYARSSMLFIFPKLQFNCFLRIAPTPGRQILRSPWLILLPKKPKFELHKTLRGCYNACVILASRSLCVIYRRFVLEGYQTWCIFSQFQLVGHVRIWRKSSIVWSGNLVMRISRCVKG